MLHTEPPQISLLDRLKTEMEMFFKEQKQQTEAEKTRLFNITLPYKED